MDTTTSTQVVKAEPTSSGTPSLDEAVQANLNTGILLLCKEALVTAIQDRRLHRGHLRVLAAIATFMNSTTAKAWPGRAAIATLLGMPVKTVSNLLLELRGFGYLIADKQAVEEANNKRLTVYTWGKIDHETIRREITSFVEGVRSGKVPPWREPESPAPAGQSRPGGNSKVPSQRDSPIPAGLFPEKVPPQRAEKSRPSGDSNSIKELKTHTRECAIDNLPRGEELGHGVVAAADAITHPKFAISLSAVRMQAALSPDLAGVDLNLACRAAALQWAVALESGQHRDMVIPGNVVGAILGGIRKGQYSAHEHKARLAKAQGKPKLSRW